MFQLYYISPCKCGKIEYYDCVLMMWQYYFYIMMLLVMCFVSLSLNACMADTGSYHIKLCVTRLGAIMFYTYLYGGTRTVSMRV